jgi:hypothetical protein
MGYSTDFTGEFNLNKPLTIEHAAYLNKFASTRRMTRNASMTNLRPDPIRHAAGVKDVGPDGGFFVGESGFCGQDSGNDVIDNNRPPSDQPSLWCLWVPTNDNMGLMWNGGEKFHDYIEWLEYLIDNFLKPWGYVLNGEVKWFGEGRGDAGIIVAKKNVVSTKRAKISYVDYDGS